MEESAVGRWPAFHRSSHKRFFSSKILKHFDLNKPWCSGTAFLSKKEDDAHGDRHACAGCAAARYQSCLCSVRKND